VLHLAGLDHVKTKDAKVMEAQEVTLLKKLKITDPYADGAVNLG